MTLPSSSLESNSNLQKELLKFCRHMAGSYKISAICQSDNYTIEAPSSKSTIEVLLIIRDFPSRLMTFVRAIEGRNVVIFAVDQWIFERDVDRGFLGEALASMLIFPYTPLVNIEYLHRQEIEIKKRLVLELLENIVLSYPELSYSIRIKPEYFMYEIMMNRVRVFPPLAYGTSHLLSGKSTQKISRVLQGYLQAIEILDTYDVLHYSNGYVTLSKTFIEKSKNPATKFTNAIKNAPRALFSSFFGVFPQLLNFLSQNSEAFLQFQTPPWKKDFFLSKSFLDPQKFIYIPTARGLVSLADKSDIRAFAGSILKERDTRKIKVEEFGGVLNDVYLLKIGDNPNQNKILVKRFKDLSSFKWFPLSIWSIGVTTFALLGKSRLERECAINELLAEEGFNVPKILHVSTNERLVFMEFLEGENLSYAIKRIASAENLTKVETELVDIEKLGQTYAHVHFVGVVLGDTKPENTMIGPQGKLYLLDFEQASRKGDKSWDVACFLYYSGHYLPQNGEKKAEAIAQAFIKGYLTGGGKIETVRCAGIAKYTRVFSVFTLPGILRTMASICKTTSQKMYPRLVENQILKKCPNETV